MEKRYVSYGKRVIVGLFLVGFLVWTFALRGGVGQEEHDSGPAFAMFLRIHEGFQKLVQDGGSANASGSTSLAEMFSMVVGSWQKFRSSALAPAVEESKFPDSSGMKNFLQALKKLAQEKSFSPESISIVVKNEREYVVLLRGEFSPRLFRSCFAREMMVERSDGFSLMGNAFQISGEQVVIHFGETGIFLCPVDFEGNVMDAYQANSGEALGISGTFADLMKEKPLLAMEAKLESLFVPGKGEGEGGRSGKSAVEYGTLCLGPSGIRIKFGVKNGRSKDEMQTEAKQFLASLPPEDIFSGILKNLTIMETEAGIELSGEGIKGDGAIAQIGCLGTIVAFGMANYEKALTLAKVGENKTGKVSAVVKDPSLSRAN